jgi:hypothetical protein
MVGLPLVYFDVAIIVCARARPSVEYGGISVLAH